MLLAVLSTQWLEPVILKTFQSQDGFTFLKTTEDARTLIMRVIVTNICPISRYNRTFKITIHSKKKNPLHVNINNFIKNYYIPPKKNWWGALFCTSAILFNIWFHQRQVNSYIWHSWFIIQPLALFFRLKSMKQIWPHTDMWLEKGGGL